MNYIGQVVSAANGIYRTVKATVFGPKDVKSAPEGVPFGIDSNPIAGMKAVYIQTSAAGQPVIIGYYVNSDKPTPNQPVAMPGEARLYSTDANGNLITYLWLHNTAGDGQVEIGGTADNAVSYNNLQVQFNELNSKFNKLVDAFNQHEHATAATGPPSIPTPVPLLIPAIESTADITQAQKKEIKTM